MLTFGAVLIVRTWLSTASRSIFAARHADALVGNWFTVPIFFERRLPFSQKKKFQVLIRLSRTTLPCRALIESSGSWEQRTAIQRLAHRSPSAQCRGRSIESATSGDECRRERTLALSFAEPTSVTCAVRPSGIGRLLWPWAIHSSRHLPMMGGLAHSAALERGHG